MAEKVKQYHNWVKNMTMLSEEARMDYVKTILNSIVEAGIERGEEEQARELIRLLKKKSFFELIGFSINANYVMSHVRSTKTNPISQEDLEALFIHAWGSPKLLYKHKKLPMLVIVGADIQLDESILDEMEDNSEITKVIGITG